MGTPDRFAYTLLGDEVTASRPGGNEGLRYLIVGHTLIPEASDGSEWRLLDQVAVRDGTRTLVWSCLGIRGGLPNIPKPDVYERRLGAYSQGFQRAARCSTARRNCAPVVRARSATAPLRRRSATEWMASCRTRNNDPTRRIGRTKSL